MKKVLTIIASIIIFSASAQDFDYSFFTSRCELPYDSTNKTLKLSLFRKIEKQNNVLKVISLICPSNVDEYKILFIGMVPNDEEYLLYIDAVRMCRLRIYPMQSLLIITDDKLKRTTTYSY